MTFTRAHSPWATREPRRPRSCCCLSSCSRWSAHSCACSAAGAANVLGSRVRQMAPTVAAVIAAAAFAAPLYWMRISALGPEKDIFAYLFPLSSQGFLPATWTIANFTDVLDTGFLSTTGNSLLVAAVTTVGGLAIAIPSAFALSVLRFRFRRVLFAIIVLSFSVPFDVVAVPLSGVFRDWNLDNTYTGLILPGLGNGFAIFLLRQFFLAVPLFFQEGARLGGATLWRIMWGIYVPLSRPAIIGAALIIFTNPWQAYFGPLLVVPEPNMQLAPITFANP